MAIWKIDPTHASADFSARHMMITTVRAGFKTVNGTINFDEANPANSSVEVTIDVASMSSTGLAQRDQHLMSPDFLDAAQFPTITFKSTKVVPHGATEADITGDLTIRGVTRPVTIKAELLGKNKTPWGSEVVGFTGTTKINREDWGLNWNQALEAGGWLVGKEVSISLDVEGVKVPETEAQTA
jgi:polyisoprenoid-binding protein YceI